MFKFLNLQPEIFGIDINDYSLRILKLRKKGKFFNLVSFNEVNIPVNVVNEGVIQDPDSLVKSIQFACDNVKGERLGTRYLIASLPEEKSFSQVIEMPKMSDRELKLAVPLEAENYIPLAIDKVYLDFQVINSPKNDSKKIDLLVNAMPKPIVDSYVSCFKRSGLIAAILETESQSITRALTWPGANMLPVGKKNVSDSEVSSASPPLLLIDLGVANTSFIVFSDNSVRFTSSIPVSSRELTKAVSDNLAISFDGAEELKIKYGISKEGEKYGLAKTMEPILKELALQIKKYISFYHSHFNQSYPSSNLHAKNVKIEKIILCGGGANLKGLVDFLSGELKISVQAQNPFVNVVAGGKNRLMIGPEKALSFTTAMGLAIRGADNGR